MLASPSPAMTATTPLLTAPCAPPDDAAPEAAPFPAGSGPALAAAHPGCVGGLGGAGMLAAGMRRTRFSSWRSTLDKSRRHCCTSILRVCNCRLVSGGLASEFSSSTRLSRYMPFNDLPSLCVTLSRHQPQKCLVQTLLGGGSSSEEGSPGRRPSLCQTPSSLSDMAFCKQPRRQGRRLDNGNGCGDNIWCPPGGPKVRTARRARKMGRQIGHTDWDLTSRDPVKAA